MSKRSVIGVPYTTAQQKNFKVRYTIPLIPILFVILAYITILVIVL